MCEVTLSPMNSHEPSLFVILYQGEKNIALTYDSHDQK